MIEKRKDPRIQINHPVVFSDLDAHGALLGQDAAVALDISAKGMMIEASRPVHGHQLKIRASTKNEKSVEVQGMVIYSFQSAEKTFRVGLYFIGEPDQISHFVEEIIGSSQD